MAARLARFVVALGLLLGAALPSAAAAVVRLTTSHETVHSVVPDRGADPLYARSYFGARYYRADVWRFTTIDPVYSWEGVRTMSCTQYVRAAGISTRFLGSGGFVDFSSTH
jgi:hypothetical protein